MCLEKNFFYTFLYSLWIFAFLRKITTWSIIACHVKSFGLSQWQSKAKATFFFFRTRSAVFSYVKWCPRFLSRFCKQWRYPGSRDLEYFTFPRRAPIRIQQPVEGCPADRSAAAESPVPLLSWLVETTYIQPSCYTMSAQSVQPVPTVRFPTTTSHQHRQSYYLQARGKCEPPAAEINGERVLQFSIIQNAEENLPAPYKEREREREWGGCVGEAWITWSVAQTTGSLW